MNSAPDRVPPALAVGLVLAVVLDTGSQIFWKAAVGGVPEGASLWSVCARPLFWAAMLTLGAQLWNWLRVLARADLSFAQPFTALSYVTVLAISAALFHERMSPSKLAGVALILTGVWFISRTPVRTPSEAP